ncbi:Hypothetical protein DEACI_2265 [Acididesulfobacillus acetoxydans]|uniref:Competence protein A n=1 Tax=Acididesulfobacillus acetoxydans TaxID=1561005 RepID=A0A8S0W3E8_9FIRM|nr:PilN domain-containing protein [Acididesulfobacillus acetoxydans]CAA7601598.1 Hypothetical protein DEACI_2265 [Acididesulfobacillus acetoxydans]CEJ07085.1 Competence protein A [Acididesulfobacillus acetoxydans]
MSGKVFIELTDGEIRFLWVDRGPLLGKLRRVALERLPLPAGIMRQGLLLEAERLTAILKAYRRERGVIPPAFLLLPWQQGFARGFRLPWFSAGQRRQALNYFIEEETPISGEEVLNDFSVVEEKRGKFLEVLAAAVRKSVLTDFVRSFAEAGFRVERVDLAVTALSCVLPLESGQNVLYLKEDEDQLEMALFRGTRLEVVRTFGKAGADADEIEVWRELKRTLFYYAAQDPDFSLQRVCTPDPATAGETGERMRQSLGYAVDVCPAVALPRDFEKFRGVLKEVPAAYAASAAYRTGQGLNLWRQEEEQRKVRRRIAWGIGAVVILLAGVFAFWWPVQARSNRLEEELAVLRPQGYRAEKSIRQEEILAESWDKLHRQPLVLADSLRVMTDWQGSGLTLTEIEYKEGKINLKGKAEKGAQVEKLMQKMQSQGWVSPVLAAYRVSGDAISFTVGASRPQAGKP